MRRESLFPFVPAALAALTNAATAAIGLGPTGVPRQVCRLSGRDVRGGSVGGSSKQVVAVRRFRAIDCRGAHFNGGGASLSSDVLCCCVGNGER